MKVGAIFCWISTLLCVGVCIKRPIRSERPPMGMEEKVYRDLLEDYKPSIRPGKGVERTNVGVMLDLQTLQRVEDQNSVMSVVAFLYMKWNDPRLRWNATEYGGFINMVLPPTDVWVPDVGVINSNTGIYEENWFNYYRVNIMDDGSMTWQVGGHMEVTCRLDVTYFPRDRQTCSVRVAPVAYLQLQVEIEPLGKNISMKNYEGNGQWDIIATRTRGISIKQENLFSAATVSMVIFEIDLARKSFYYFVSLVMPVIFIQVALFVSFWLPAGCGEKMSVGVTVLLAYSVLLLVIADKTPADSEHIPRMSHFLVASMCIATLSLVCSCVTISMHNRSNGSRPPAWLRNISYNFLAKIFCVSVADSKAFDKEMKKKKQEKRAVLERSLMHHSLLLQNKADKSALNNKLQYDEGRDLGFNYRNVMPETKKSFPEQRAMVIPAAESGVYSSTLEKDVKDIAEKLLGDETEEAVEQEWRVVAAVLDRLFFFLTLILTITIFVVFLGEPDTISENLTKLNEVEPLRIPKPMPDY